MSQKITGPLGFWRFPLLNFILGAMATRRGVPILQNEEVITWTDWTGKERRTVIHRSVK